MRKMMEVEHHLEHQTLHSLIKPLRISTTGRRDSASLLSSPNTLDRKMRISLCFARTIWHSEDKILYDTNYKKSNKKSNYPLNSNNIYTSQAITRRIGVRLSSLRRKWCGVRSDFQKMINRLAFLSNFAQTIMIRMTDTRIKLNI